MAASGTGARGKRTAVDPLRSLLRATQHLLDLPAELARRCSDETDEVWEPFLVDDPAEVPFDLTA